MQRPEPEPQVIDLREFFGVLRRRKWSIILVAAVVVGLAVAQVYHRQALYTSTARVEVRPTAAGDLQAFYYDAFVNMDTEAARVTSEPVTKLAAPDMGLTASSPSQLANAASGVSVSIPANTTYLDISCTESSPEAAKTCANAFAVAYAKDRINGAQASYNIASDAFLKQIRDAQAQIRAEGAKPVPNQSTIDSLTSTEDSARLKLLSLSTPSPYAAVQAITAESPSAPSNKDSISSGVLALILGLALGVGLAFVRERLDERVGGRESLENALDAPVLAVVPHVAGWRNKKDTRVVTLSSPDSPASEAYKTVRSTILYLASQQHLKVLAIAGPGQGEGKTTTTVNLAVSLAQAGKKVAAVSCDLRRPRMHRFFKLENTIGVSTVLKGEATLEQAMQDTAVAGLSMIASGPVPHNTAELLGSPRMQAMLDQLRERFDFVLLDTSPALVVADAVALAPYSDGVIVVVDASKTALAAVSQMRNQLERVGGRVVGGVLNNLDPKSAKRYPAYYRSYYSSSYRYAEPNGRDKRKDKQEPEPAETRDAGGPSSWS